MSIKSAYLALYNAASAGGWAYVNYLVWADYLETGSFNNAFAASGDALYLVQTAAVLEIVHSALGLVRASAFTTFLQVFSRVAILWGVLHLSATAAASPAAFLCIASWGLVEVPRYTYLLVHTLGTAPAWFTWIRYSLFLVLYPTGISGEMISMYFSLDDLDQGAASITMPNTYNFVYNHAGVMRFLLYVVWPMGAYTMYTHMLKQRGKKLSAGGGKKNKKE